MSIEQAIETQRLRLLRLVAGLLAAVVFLSVGPLPRLFSSTVSYILIRAEAAAQYLLIAYAGLIVDKKQSAINRAQLLEYAPAISLEEKAFSPVCLRRRLIALRKVLEDLPRYALRLLHRIEKHIRRAQPISRTKATPFPADTLKVFCVKRLTGNRIERPPDKMLRTFKSKYLLPETAGGKGG